MEQSTFIGIGSIFASVIFGLWGIYYAIKSKYPGQITFLKEQTIALFDTIVKNLPELSILYKGVPVKPNIVLVRGALVNTGKKDISPSMTEKPITISLPEDYKWLTAKVISTSDNVQANISLINEISIVINTGLFRCREYIGFQALAEVPTEGKHNGNDTNIEKLTNLLIFSHRISDTRKINKVELTQGENISKRLRRYIIFSILGTAAFFTFLVLILIKGIPGQFVYHYKIKPNEIVVVTAKPLNNNNVRITAIDSSFSEIIPVDKFFSNCTKQEIRADKYFIFSILFLFGYVLIPLGLLLYNYREYKINKRLRRMLSLE